MYIQNDIQISGVYSRIHEEKRGQAAMETGKRKIVVADDEEIVVAALVELLLKEYEVFTAANGSQALDVTRRINPDLVILDVAMPVMDGMETCRRIKYGAGTDKIPVLMLTAKGDLECALEGFNSGADSYMVKPFITDMLLEKIEELIKRAEIKKSMN